MYSDDFKINVNKLNADEAVLVCVEIKHPFISDAIRLVNDSRNLVSNGHTYLAMPFEIKRQDDVEGELPKVTFTVQNVGRTLTKWVDSSGGGDSASFDILLIRRSSPDNIEEKLSLGVDTVKLDTMNVSFNLIIQNNLVKRSVRYVYDTKRSPGLF